MWIIMRVGQELQEEGTGNGQSSPGCQGSQAEGNQKFLAPAAVLSHAIVAGSAEKKK
jgi:hypothetical protein